MESKVLVTGGAGFIGFHLCRLLLEKSFTVIAVDNLNDYYDPKLKEDRLALLRDNSSFFFHKADIEDKSTVDNIFETYRPSCVIHLAAQAGVRYSIENPYTYINSNILGFINILEACRHNPVRHLIFASSSSVYGGNKAIPFSTQHNVDHPVSLYAATKKSNELMAHAYSYLYGIPATGLRFFTVYGPWGRPDMAYFSFTKNIFENKPINVYNHGHMKRDFTYIDDITEAVYRLIDRPPVANNHWDGKDASTSFAQYKIYNIGNNEPTNLMLFIETLEDLTGKKAEKIFMDMQPGDVQSTYADVADLEKDVDFRPRTSTKEGLAMFVEWYRQYFNI